MKILIVDDEDIQRQKLVQLISESPLSFSDILCAPEVPTAIDIIETHHPDIVLSDIRMPVKNGLDLAQYVKETYPEILVILITGYSEFKYAQAAIRYNVFDYILKPIDAESTLSCIRHAIAKLEAADVGKVTMKFFVATSMKMNLISENSFYRSCFSGPLLCLKINYLCRKICFT